MVVTRAQPVATLEIPKVDRLRRLAVLHKEVLHILMRVDDQPPGESWEPMFVAELDRQRVCLGAPESGTQVLAKVLLRRHGVRPEKAVEEAV